MDLWGEVSTKASVLAFEAAQREVVECLAGGAQLGEILERIVVLIERQASELRASILLFDAERGCVRHGAVPDLPPALEQVWSTPIFDTDRAVLGTVATYTREARGPTASEKEVIAKATHLAAVAITHDRTRQRGDLTPLPHRRPQSVHAIHDDVSNRKRLEAQVFRAQRMESLGTMAGGIAHDFSNILAAVLGNARLAAHILPEEAGARECFDAIESACARAADLVKRITTFSRPQDAERRLLEPRPVVEEALKLMRTSWPGVEVHTRFAVETPPIFADETQIHQIVMNLGANAAQAMKGRDGRVEIELEAVTIEDDLPLRDTEPRPGAYARLSVRDTGTGMDEATLDQIFDPFFTTKPVSEGTGLGLSVVHGIVKNHGGFITVHSRPERGTVFHIYLPAATQATAWAAAAKAAVVVPAARAVGSS